MKKRLSYIASFIFLCFILLPLLAVVFFQSAQWYIKWQAEERMKKEKIETITVQEKDVQWEKTGKEIWLDGKLFDVESYTVSNGIITAKGFLDYDETSLFTLLVSLQHNKKNSVLQQFFLLLQCFAVCMVIIQLFGLYRAGILIKNHFSSSLPHPCYLVLGHPPKQFVVIK